MTVPWSVDLNYNEDGASRIGAQRGDWDVVIIGGRPWPGIATVNVSSRSGVDVKKPVGGKRAALKDNGDYPLSIDISLKLTPSEIVELSRIVVPMVRGRGKTAPKDVLEFIHPTAELWGIQNVMVLSCSQAHPEPGGFMTFKVKAIEWVPAPANVKASGKKRTGDQTGLSPYAIIEPSQFLTDPLYAARGEYESAEFSVRQLQSDGTVREVPIDPYSTVDEALEEVYL